MKTRFFSDKEEWITIGNNVKRNSIERKRNDNTSDVLGRHSHVFSRCSTLTKTKGARLTSRQSITNQFEVEKYSLSRYATTSVSTVRDDCVRDAERGSCWLSIVLVLLLTGDALSLPIFVSISSRESKKSEKMSWMTKNYSESLIAEKKTSRCKSYSPNNKTTHYHNKYVFN